jgi:hypothetical protein
MKVRELIALLESQEMPDARVVKFERDGKLAIDLQNVSKIELNLREDEGGRDVVAIA